MARPQRRFVKSAPIFWRDAELPFEGRQSFDCSACYREHTHPTLSIGILDEGRSVLTLPNERVDLCANDVVVIYPGEVHACNPQPGSRWSYRMFYFDWDWAYTIFAGTHATTKRRPLQRCIRAASAVALLDRLSSTMSSDASRAQKLREGEACLRSLVVLSTQAAPSAAAQAPAISQAIRRTRDYIEAHLEERLPLALLARAAGLTSFHFLRRFKKEVGLTPHAYQLDQRINRARQLLRTSRATADVAYALGFSDQSHFQRVFKNRVAATPREFQAGVCD